MKMNGRANTGEITGKQLSRASYPCRDSNRDIFRVAWTADVRSVDGTPRALENHPRVPVWYSGEGKSNRIFCVCGDKKVHEAVPVRVNRHGIDCDTAWLGCEEKVEQCGGIIIRGMAWGECQQRRTGDFDRSTEHAAEVGIKLGGTLGGFVTARRNQV